MKKQSNFSRLLGYAGGRGALAYLSWFLAAASALLAMLPFWYIWRILDEVIKAAPSFENAVCITDYGWMAVLFAALAVLVYIAGLTCSHLCAFRIATNLRIELTNRISLLPLGTLERFGSGKLRRIVSETAGASETYLAHQLPDKWRVIGTVAGMLFLLFVFDWRLGLLSLAPVLLAFLCMSSMMGKELQQKMTEYQNSLSEMSNEAVEYVRGIPVVKTFGQTVYSFKKFKGTIDNYEKWTINYTLSVRGPMLGYTLAINSVFAFLILGAFWLSHGSVTPEFLLDMLFYIIITPVISVTLTKVMYMTENEMVVADAIERIDGILNEQPLPESEKPLHPSDNSVELRDVSYSYDGKRNAVSGVSLRVNADETAALVGPSGGGKTTLAGLIARFYDPRQGSVLIGGVDIRDIPKAELMNTVSFVFQNSRLIKGSILDNVRLGKPDASEEEIMAALSAAQCDDIIEKLPQGINTPLGSKGVYLSGGETQRIAIARAILKNAPIIILDEATAFADPDNEVRVQAALSALARGKTVIMIAHRLSTVRSADKIFVLRGGEIVQSGSFEGLKCADGLFGDMWRDYQTAVQWKVAKEA